MPENVTLLERSQVPQEQTWGLESIFPSVQEWEDAYREVEAQLPELRRFPGKLGEGPGILADCLETYERIFRLLGKVSPH